MPADGFAGIGLCTFRCMFKNIALPDRYEVGNTKVRRPFLHSLSLIRNKKMTIYNNHPHVGRQASDFRYVDLGKHWNSRIKPVFESDVVQAQLFQDFGKFVRARNMRFYGIHSDIEWQNYPTYSYFQTVKPVRWDNSDWRSRKIGRPYSFDDYICFGACHCIVNSLLLTARIAYPDNPWVIVSGKHHSTVWDQCLTFFDMNYFALKVSPEDCAINTVLNQECIILAEGELLELA